MLPANIAITCAITNTLFVKLSSSKDFFFVGWNCRLTKHFSVQNSLYFDKALFSDHFSSHVAMTLLLPTNSNELTAIGWEYSQYARLDRRYEIFLTHLWVRKGKKTGRLRKSWSFFFCWWVLLFLFQRRKKKKSLSSTNVSVGFGQISSFEKSWLSVSLALHLQIITFSLCWLMKCHSMQEVWTVHFIYRWIWRKWPDLLSTFSSIS